MPKVSSMSLAARKASRTATETLKPRRRVVEPADGNRDAGQAR